MGKSLRLSVMSVRLCSMAVAATIMSASVSVRPFLAWSDVNRPARRAMAAVMG